jgi:hypothetical protein
MSVGVVEALVEHPELVARLNRAREIHVPGEDVGEVVGELRPLAQVAHRSVQARRHDPGDARHPERQLGLLVAHDILAALEREVNALGGGRPVTEILDPTLEVLGQAKAVARLSAPEIEGLGHLFRHEVDHALRHVRTAQRSGQRIAALELAHGDHRGCGGRLRLGGGGRHRLRGVFFRRNVFLRRRGFFGERLGRDDRTRSLRGLERRQREQRRRRDHHRQRDRRNQVSLVAFGGPFALHRTPELRLQQGLGIVSLRHAIAHAK